MANYCCYLPVITYYVVRLMANNCHYLPVITCYVVSLAGNYCHYLPVITCYVVSLAGNYCHYLPVITYVVKIVANYCYYNQNKKEFDQLLYLLSWYRLDQSCHIGRHMPHGFYGSTTESILYHSKHLHTLLVSQ